MAMLQGYDAFDVHMYVYMRVYLHPGYRNTNFSTLHQSMYTYIRIIFPQSTSH